MYLKILYGKNACKNIEKNFDPSWKEIFCKNYAVERWNIKSLFRKEVKLSTNLSK